MIKTEATEEQIINGCIAGDSQWQTLLYKQYSGKLYTICLRYADSKDEANDYLQEGFMKIYRSLEKFRFEGSFEGWLKRLVVNCCLDLIKKNKKFRFEENLDSAYNLKIEDGVLEVIEAKRLLDMLQELPPGYRTVFNMYAIEGYSHAEIGKELGISENTSKTQLFKARKSLQHMLLHLKGENFGK